MEKKIKCIEDAYYIDATDEGKRLFGETIIESALVKLDLSWVLRKYTPRRYTGEYSKEDRGLEGALFNILYLN